MKKVLITGGKGDIAQAIKDNLEQSGEYDIYTPGKDELDVTSIKSVDKYISSIIPDILINNAGFVFPQSISDCSIEIEKKSIDINLFGAFNCAATALKYNSNVHIINIGSSAATKVHGTWSSYCATKAALVMATNCWADDGVHCICISPGRTATKMRKGLYPNEDMKTLMTTSDFAKVVVYALEDKYPNGSHINVNVDNVKNYINEYKK